MIRINDQTAIGEDELEYEYARSSGPGGQNVNKVETKVTLRFDVDQSPSLDDEMKEKIRERLATRITKLGVLRVVSQRHRTRGANQKAVVEKFIELVAGALDDDPPRRPTRIPKGAKKRRLENKRHRSEKKKLRSRIDHDW